MTDEAKKPAKPKPQTVRVKGGQLVSVQVGAITAPNLIFKGDEPNKGDTLVFKLANGVTYSGVVSEAVEIDGEVCAEFTNGVSPT